MTALHHAACYGLKDTVAFLFKHKVNADARNFEGKTPLYCAVDCAVDSEISKYQAVISKLQPKCGIDPVNNNGRTPLIYAAHNGQHQILEILLQKGAAHSHKDGDGKTSLIHVSQQGHELVVQLLLDNGADIHQVEGGGKTPLIWAAREGHERVVQLLLVYGANVNQVEKDDKTPLIWTASGGHDRVVQILLECGAEVNRTRTTAGHR